MNKTAFLYDDIYLGHDTGYGHPERPERLIAIINKLKSASYYDDLIQVKPILPNISYIELIHSKDYIKRVMKEIEQGTQFLDSMDTVVCPHSYDIALKAVGGGLNMCDTIMSQEAMNGFLAVRPPGHHAEYDYAAGFCIFNNIAIAAKYLQAKHNIDKIAIVDWDVHHGNGTQHSFEYDNSVFYVSLHQFPHYPGTGSHTEQGVGIGKGYTLNIPMRSGSGDSEYLTAFKEVIVPALDNFKPEIILISAGFDAHQSDPLSGIRLSSDMYYQFTAMLMEVAANHSKERVMAFLEGGYNLNALAEGVHNVMRAFTGNN